MIVISQNFYIYIYLYIYIYIVLLSAKLINVDALISILLCIYLVKVKEESGRIGIKLYSEN